MPKVEVLYPDKSQTQGFIQVGPTCVRRHIFLLMKDCDFGKSLLLIDAHDVRKLINLLESALQRVEP